MEVAQGRADEASGKLAVFLCVRPNCSTREHRGRTVRSVAPDARHFRGLEAKYLRMGLSPKAATSAAMKEMLATLSTPAPRRLAKRRA